MSMHAKKTTHDYPPFESSIDDVLEIMPCVVCTLQFSGGRSVAISYATGKLSDLTGLDPQEVSRDAAPLLSRMDAEDSDRFFASAEDSARSMTTWQTEFRLDHPTKDKVWIELRATPLQREGRLVWQGFMCDITARKQSEQALSRSERSYRNLAESSPDFVIRYDLEHRIRYLNAKFVHELKLDSAEEVLGRRPDEVWPDGRFAAIDEAAKASRETGKEVVVELSIIEDDGSAGNRQILVVPEWDENGRCIGTLAFGRDFTRFKQLESQLSERNAFQATLLDAINAVDMQLMVVESGKIIHVGNRRIAREFGYSDTEIDAGIPFVDIIHPADRARVLDNHRRRLAGEQGVPSTYEFALQTKRGERRDYETSVAVVPGSDPLRVVSIGKDITQRKRAERELLLLQHAINQSSEPLFITDATSMRFTIVNDAACRSLGYSREELQSMTVVDIDPNFSLEQARQTIRTTELKSQHSIETQHRRKDGRLFPVEVSGTFFKSGGVRYSITFARDITKRKRTENTLRFIAEHGGERHFLVALALHLSEVLNAAFVAIGRLAGASVRAETVVFSADGTILPDIRHALEDIPECCFSDDGCCNRKGMRTRLPKGSLLGDLGVDSLACLSLRDSTGKSVGVIAVMDREPFREEEAVRQLLQIVAPRAAAELERAESDRQLRRREQEFRSLAENSPENIIRYDRECRQIYANPSVVETLMQLLGRNPMGETPNQAYPDGTFSDYDAVLRRVIATGRMEDFEFMLPDRGEGAQYHMIRMAPEKNEAGEVVGVVAFGRDITGIREDERRLRHFVDSLPGMAYSFRLSPDGQGSFAYLSAGVEELYGLKPGEAEGDMRTIDSLLHPEDRPRVEAAIAESAKTLSPFHVECRICPVGLPVRWVDVRSVPESQADGSLLWYGIMLDITERVEAAENLKQAHEFSEKLINALPDPVFVKDRQHRWIMVNDALCDLLGQPRGAIIGKTDYDYLPAEQADVFWEKDDRVFTTGEENINDETIVDAEGNLLAIQTKKTLVNNDTLIGVIRDLTQIRRAEAELRANEEKLRMAASVFEAATEGIVITDPQGRILDTNPAFARISGYSREEALGKRPNIMASGRHDQAFYRLMWQKLHATGVWSGEVVNRHKSGELFTEQLNIVTVHDESGRAKYYIGIFSDISLLKQHEEHLRHLAHHDDLTGLPNRLLLTDRLTHAIAQARRDHRMLAVVYLDLDGFKPINDNHGHEVGDRVLVEIAKRLSERLRASDTVARIGGDEFVALLAGISDMGECEFTVHRLLETISRPILYADRSLEVTASIGICIYPNDAQEDADMLLRCADQAMYLAKNAGRNQFVFYDSYAQSNAWNHSQTIYDLRQALHQNQISVHYQPIIELNTGRACMAEALVRWRHPVRGMVPPSEFIPAAENGGLVHEIGDLVFKQAADLAQTWSNHEAVRKGEQPHISVNRSPRQFFSNHGIVSWRRILEEKGVSGGLLSVEITEGLLLDDRAEVLDQLKQLRSLGISISIDDFGTGYSSLSYLKKFNIDYLKIDRSFVRDIAHDADDRAIVESIIVMASRLGIKTIAEGVETREQAELLKNAGCGMGQGYFFAKPMPQEEFLEFVASDRD